MPSSGVIPSDNPTVPIADAVSNKAVINGIFSIPLIIIAPARNRRIKKEWNGYNSKELAEKYNLTTKQIGNILKDEPMIGQMSIFDMNNDD